MKTEARTYQSKIHPQLSWENVVFDGVGEAVASIGNNRYVIRGKPSITVIDSVKWGQQVQFLLYGRVRKEPRAGSREWDRIEVDFSIDDLDDLIMVLKAKRAEVKDMEGV